MRRIKADIRPGPKADVDFDHKPHATSPAATSRSVQPRKASSRAADQSWVGTGIFRAVLLAVIVIVGVAAVIWVRNLATTFGVHWLGNG